LLLCSSGLASAAGGGAPIRISDDLVLTGAQEHLIRQRVVRSASASAPAGAGAATPAGFQPSLYAVVPPSIALHALPAEVTGQIPMVSPYKYATFGTLVLIVNPADRTIVDIIRP
jgi:hypothetical protein